MEIGLFGLFSLLSLVFLFEGYQRKNPLMMLTASIMLMITATDVHLNGINYPSGAVINEAVNGSTTTIQYTYAVKTQWYVQMIDTVLFSLGFVSLAWYPLDYYSRRKGKYDMSDGKGDED